MSPVPGERPAPGLPRRRTNRRATDRYLAWGFFGIHLVATLVAVRVAFFVAVPQWHDRWWALAMFVAGLLPLYAAVGVYAHSRRQQAAARQARYQRQYNEGGGR